MTRRLDKKGINYVNDRQGVLGTLQIWTKDSGTGECSLICDVHEYDANKDEVYLSGTLRADNRDGTTADDDRDHDLIGRHVTLRLPWSTFKTMAEDPITNNDGTPYIIPAK